MLSFLLVAPVQSLVYKGVVTYYGEGAGYKTGGGDGSELVPLQKEGLGWEKF